MTKIKSARSGGEECRLAWSGACRPANHGPPPERRGQRPLLRPVSDL